MKRSNANYWIYIGMMAIFGVLIYFALSTGQLYDRPAAKSATNLNVDSFELFQSIISGNLANSLTIMLLQIIVILFTVRIFSFLFRYIGQPGVMGEILAGIVLGPSLLGYVFPDFFVALFPPESMGNLKLLSETGLVLFMFVIGLEVDFSVIKDKLHETLVISHAGIVVPFFLGVLAAIGVYQEYGSRQADFLPFALFIGISMTSVGMLSIASAANDDVTAWCLLAIVIALAKAGSFVSALYTIALTVVYIVLMFKVMRPFLRKLGEAYVNSEVINKAFVGFIFLLLVVSSVATEIIGIHALFGAFMAGVIMPANIGFRKVMMEKVEDVSLVFFLPLFFAFSGLHTEIGLINSWELWGVCLLFVVVAIVGKLGGCTLAARIVGESWKNSLIVGTLMNTRGLMQLVALNIGLEMGILSSQMFVVLLIMSLLTTFMTTPLLSLVERIFAKQAEKTSHNEKVMLSFGLPESGRTLLNMADLLLGDRLQTGQLIATHFTVGTELSPTMAEEFKELSFIPLRAEAKKLSLKVEERYHVTEKLIQDMVRMAKREHVDYLFVGAGRQFMQSENAAERKTNSRFSFLPGLSKLLKSPSLSLPGLLLRQKLESIMEEVDCSVGIFVNRGFTKASEILLLVDSEQDLFLFNYARTRLGEKSMTIRICFADKQHDSYLEERVMTDFVQQDSAKFVLGKPPGEIMWSDAKECLLVMSYAACEKLSRNHQLFAALPSLLIIRPRLDEA